MPVSDEFYTQYQDIVDEISHYPTAFRNKTVYCNCDDPRMSNFWKFFHYNFSEFGIKRLVATHCNLNGEPSFVMEYDGGNDSDHLDGHITPLQGNGDFRSEECTEILKRADIVVSNAPFSLFQEYVTQLMDYRKQFIIIGSKHSITYKGIFPYIKNNKMWVGYTSMSKAMWFETTSDYASKFDKIVDGRKLTPVAACWFTNIDHPRRHVPLVLTRSYNPSEYEKFDNYDAINIDHISDIPKDYDLPMGVPVSILNHLCPEQFRILGTVGDYPPTKVYHRKVKVVDGIRMPSQSGRLGCVVRKDAFGEGTYFDVGYPVKVVYKRIFIQSI